MFSSGYLKQSARDALKDCYLPAVVCALLYIVPQYLCEYISTFINPNAVLGIELIYGIQFLVKIFVVDVFAIGLFRFLSEIKTDEDKKISEYNYNMLFSGYKMNFGNTLKITFVKTLKLVLWIALALVPAALFAAAVFFIVPRDVISNFISMSYMLSVNMTEQGITELSEYINTFMPYYVPAMLCFMLLSIIAVIPLIRKVYEYAMIPMIVADDADIRCKDAFKKTKELMDGYKMRYFILQLSFLLYQLAANLVLVLSGSFVLFCIIQAAVIPYMYRTYIEFYKKRLGMPAADNSDADEYTTEIIAAEDVQQGGEEL